MNENELIGNLTLTIAAQSEQIARQKKEIERLKNNDVAREIIFDMASKLNQMLLPLTATSLINGEPIGNGVDFGKEKAIFEMLRYLGELEKKYMGTKGPKND